MAKRVRSRKKDNVAWKSIDIDPYSYREMLEGGFVGLEELDPETDVSVLKAIGDGTEEEPIGDPLELIKEAGLDGDGDGEKVKGEKEKGDGKRKKKRGKKLKGEKKAAAAPAGKATPAPAPNGEGGAAPGEAKVKRKRKARSPAVKKKLKREREALAAAQAAQGGDPAAPAAPPAHPQPAPAAPPARPQPAPAAPPAEKPARPEAPPKAAQEVEEEEDSEGEGAEGEPVQDPEGAKELDMSAWTQFSLNPLILAGLRSQGFATPTPIQSLSLNPAILFKKDIVGAAQTGSGKTLSFGIPILQELLENPPPQGEKRLSALIMTPTRELGMQIVDHLNRLLMKNHVNQDPRQKQIKVVPIVGGIALPKQERLLASKPDIIVATPGRFWERMQQVDYIRYLDDLRFLVIDEADRMIEHGHFKELENILGEIKFSDPEINQADVNDRIVKEVQANAEIIEDRKKKENKSRRQTFIFSATITLSEEGRKRILSGVKKVKKIKMYKKKVETEKPNTMDRLMELVNFQRKVEIVDVTNKQKLTAEALTETKIDCMKDEKDIYLYYFFLKYPGRTLVFVNSITCIRRLVPIFKLLKLPVMGIHASMQQRKRLKNLDRFKANDRSILISTDVLSRGVDIPSVEHVIHYQVPRTTENYIHRSGRTARASNTGISLLLVSPEEVKQYRSISYVLSNEQDSIPDFPVDMTYLTTIKKRVKLAVDLDRLENSTTRKKTDNSWYKQQATALDIDLDDEIVKEQFTDDPDEESKKKLRIEQLRAELEQLLEKSILPKGASTLYITRQKFEALDGTTKHDAISDFNAKPKEKKKRIGKKNRPWNDKKQTNN